MAADAHGMVVVKGIRYREEDAKRLNLVTDADGELAELEAALAAQAEVERAAVEQQAAQALAAEQAAAQEKAAAEAAAERAAADEQRVADEALAAEKAKTPANKGRIAPTKGQ